MRINIEALSKRAVGEILDKGLADSTFRELFPQAYDDLLKHRKDLEESVRKVFVRGVKR